jgi:hypothetical protein
LANFTFDAGSHITIDLRPEPVCGSGRRRWCGTATVPQLLEAEHVLEPQQHRLHGLEVRRDVVDIDEAVAVGRGLGRRHRDRAREVGLVAAALAEPEGAVAERRGDRELAQRAAVVLEGLNLVDRRAAALLEQPERALGVLDLERERADAVRVLAEEARGPARITERRAAHDVDVAGGEARRALATALLELGARAPGLGEVELAAVEAPAALEVVDVVVDALDALDAERGELGGRRRGLGHGGGTPGEG